MVSTLVICSCIRCVRWLRSFISNHIVVRSQAKKKSNSAPAGHPLPPINVWLISQLSHTAFGVIVFMIALCLCCFMLMQTSILKSKEEPCSNFCARTAQNIVITGLLLSIPISMIVALMFVRLSTLRTSDMSSPGLLHPFNHSETDEQIFQVFDDYLYYAKSFKSILPHDLPILNRVI